jgi:hypothetical protein
MPPASKAYRLDAALPGDCDETLAAFERMNSTTAGTSIAWDESGMKTARQSMEWIRCAGEYRTLIGKRDRLGCTLGEREVTRLRELESFFRRDAHEDRPPWCHRENWRAPVSILVEFGADGAGRAVDICGEGMFVATERPLAMGARTVVRVAETGAQGNEHLQWQFAAEVVRLTGDGMGLRFVGIPLSLRVAHPLNRAA